MTFRVERTAVIYSRPSDAGPLVTRRIPKGEARGWGGNGAGRVVNVDGDTVHVTSRRPYARRMRTQVSTPAQAAAAYARQAQNDGT